MTLWLLLLQLTGAAVVSSPVSFTPGSASSDKSTLTASPNSIVANGTSTTTLTFVAADAYGNRVPAVSVSFLASGPNNTFGALSGSTNASGVFTTTLASTYAQTETVTASFSGSQTVSIPVQFVPGAANGATSTLTLSPNSQLADNSNVISALLTLRDSNNNPVPNISVSFSASGANTSISSASTTSSTGQASATYQSSLAQNENALVSAAGLNFVAAMRFVPGPAVAATSSLAASPNMVAGNGNAAITLTTTARDAQGNLVPGVSVALSASGGNNTFAAANGNTNASGTYITSLTSTIMQNETITASLSTNVNTTVNVIFTGPASTTTSSLVVNPNTQTVGPSNAIGATLVLMDAASNRLSNISPSWSATGSSNTITSSGATSASGVATASFSTTLAQNENISVAAGGINLAAPVTFVAGSPNATTSFVYAIPTHQLANNANTIVATLMLYDAYSNPISGQSASFSASGLSTSNTGSATTNNLGLARTSLQSSMAQKESVQVSAGGLSFSAPIVFTGIPASCSLSVSPNSQIPNANSTVTLTALITDNSNQPVPNVMTTFSTSGAAGPFVPWHVESTSAGIATATISSVFSGRNTFHAQAQNVQCVAQGNFLTQAPFCTGSPNYTVIANTAPNPWNVAVGDFNNDAIADIAVANIANNNIYVYLGRGDGSFQTPVVIGLSTFARALTLGDFDNDGQLDIACAAGSVLAIIRGMGSSAFTSPLYYPLSNQGYAVAAADFNADGVLDLATGIFGSGTVAISIGTGLGSFEKPVEYGANGAINYLAVGDTNGDGSPDVAVANYSAHQVSILLGRPNGTLQSPVAYATTAAPTAVSFGDLDGDGVLDVVASIYSSAVNVFFGTGTGTFTNRTNYTVGSHPQYAFVTDVNGDGMADVVVADTSANQVYTLVGSSGGSLTLQSATLANTYPKHVAAGDFNGDGKQDLAVAYSNKPGLYVYLNGGCQ